MSKSILTMKIEETALRCLSKLGTFLCPEVGITTKVLGYPKYWREDIVLKAEKENWPKYELSQTEIVDILSWESKKDIWRCYEIKISNSDFHSKSKKTFVGNYNYYIMTKELYEQVKEEIPKNIGVLLYDGKIILECAQKPKFQEISVDREVLVYSIIKSLYRETEKKADKYKKLLKEEINNRKTNLKEEYNKLYDEKKECTNEERLKEIEDEIDSIEDKRSVLFDISRIRYLW